MPNLSTTLRLYATCGREAVSTARRSPLAVLFLAAAFLVYSLVGVVVAPLGLLGSLLLGLLQAFLVGWYLALVRHALHHRRPLTGGELRDRAGALFRETLSLLFLFSIGTMLLSTGSPMLPLVAVPAASVLFNAAPEVLYQGRSHGLEILGDAWEFIRENGPEWLAVNAVIAVGFGGVRAALTGGADLSDGLIALQLFGPWFGFLGLPAWGTSGFGLVRGVVAGLFLGLLGHLVMLFRGALFLQLSSGNRRVRAFRARAGGG